MLKTVTSKENKTLKLIRSLETKKGRIKESLFIIEGYRFINYSKLYNPKYLILTEQALDNINSNENLLKTFQNLTMEILVVSEEIYKSISDTKTPQGVMCVFEFNSLNVDMDNILNQYKDYKNISILVCENIQDPGNAGTLIRTADSGGFDICIFTGNSTDPFSPKSIRSTAGSILNIPCYTYKDTKDLINIFKKYSITTYGTYLHTDNFYDTVTYSDKSALLLGNEGNGLDMDTVNLVDELIKIPIIGNAESLNVSVAGSIMIYEILRQKRSFDHK